MAYTKTIFPSFNKDEVTGQIIKEKVKTTIKVHPLQPIIFMESMCDEFIGVKLQDKLGNYLIRVNNKSEVDATHFYLANNEQKIFVDSSHLAELMTIEYYSIGGYKFSDRLIATQYDESNTVTETLNDIVTKGRASIDFYNATGSAIQLQDDLEATIVQANSKIIEGESTITNIETAIVNGDISNVKSDIVSINSSLSEKTTEINNLNLNTSDILNSDKISKQVELTNTDISSALASALSELNNRGVKYAYFDDSEIKLLSTLNHSDRLLIGKTKISAYTSHNFLYNISDNTQSFQGKINKNFCKFTQLKNAISEGRTINFTIYGDSISTNGDLIGANTSTPTGSETSPDGSQKGDTYSAFLYDMVADAMPDKAINFYNRAINGGKLFQLHDSKVFNGVTKTWIEHIKDTAPDVLVIAFGANHNNRDYQRQFAYNMKQVTDYINANFTIKPDLIFISTPRPTYRPETVWGNYLAQSTRQSCANITRSLTPKYKAYLMDVNRISNIKRSGTDWLNPTFREVTDYITSYPKDANGNYVFSTDNAELTIDRHMKDFVLKGTMTFAKTLVDGDVVTIRYNDTHDDNNRNNNQIIIVPRLTTGGLGRIRSYTNNADYLNLGASQTVEKNLATAITTLNFRIEKRDNVIEVYREELDGTNELLIRDKVNVWDIQGYIYIYFNFKTAGCAMTISNLRLFEAVYTNYLPTLTDNEAYGKYIDNDYTQKPITGGNGANHPSCYGLREMYLPCVTELAEDIAEIYRNN